MPMISRISRHKVIKARSHSLVRRSFFISILAVAALLTFTGCGLGGQTSTQAKPTATPSAQQILANAQKVKLTDETFTLTVQGTSNGTSLSVTGSGKATVNPPRVSMSLSTEVSGTTISLDEVIDGATSTSYTKITAPAAMATGKWTKATTDTSGPISSSDLDASSQYSKITNPKLIGSEQVNGVDTWHVQGETSGTSNSTIDVFVRKSDYAPVKMSMHTTGDSLSDVTIIYTAINSGFTIDLPTV
jgi:predicted small lipoprotein YifL